MSAPTLPLPLYADPDDPTYPDRWAATVALADVIPGAEPREDGGGPYVDLGAPAPPLTGRPATWAPLVTLTDDPAPRWAYSHPDRLVLTGPPMGADPLTVLAWLTFGTDYPTDRARSH